VFRVAFNVVIGVGRRRAAEQRAHAKDARVDSFDDDSSADRMTLERVLDELSPRQRQVIALRYYADLSVAETAEAMECAGGTVKALTSQALSRIRNELNVQVPAATGGHDD
jgi:RNA polymerase sigma factor (sigma-70 family)